MIDKADFRVPHNAPFTREFESMMKAADAPQIIGQNLGVWRRSQLYERMGNFEAFGLDVVFHQRCTMTPEPNHKIEILRTGDKTVADMKGIVRQMFHVEPDGLGILRTDLTADVDDIPVPWFRDNTLVQHKRTVREIGHIPGGPFMTIGKGIAETIYSGVKPNQLRIYNKTLERLQRLQKNNLRTTLQNKKNLQEFGGTVSKRQRLILDIAGACPELQEADSDLFVNPPTFEQMYGYSPDKIITRVESQIAGKSLEHFGLRIMHDLHHTPSVKPFEKLVFINDRYREPRQDEYDFFEWFTGLYFRQYAKDHGIAATKRLMQQSNKSRTNFYRRWKFYEPFIHTANRRLTYSQLQRNYEDSCHAQLYAA